MNIDLRNIDENFAKEVNRIKNRFELSTNSKAVRQATIDYLDLLDLLEKTRSEKARLQSELDNTNNNIVQYFRLQKMLKQRPKLTGFNEENYNDY